MTRKTPIHTSTQAAALRLRVAEIGEVVGVGPCWRLVYDQCGHIQEFAREGLEDPDKLVLDIQRNFPACLACRLTSATRRNAVYRRLDPSTKTSARNRSGRGLVV